MELKNYLKIINDHFGLLITVVIITTMASFIFTYTKPESYDASTAIYVSKQKSATVSTAEYQYDSYYLIQASSLFADYLIAWLKDPANVVRIYNQSKLELPTQKIKGLTQVIAAKKVQPAGVMITLNNRDEQLVRALANNTVALIKDKTDSWQKNDLDSDFILNTSEPLVIKHQKSLLLNTSIGFVIGLVLGLGLVFLVEYFNPKIKK